MPCFKPLHGYNKPGGGWTANHSASNSIPLTIPCGQCIGCRTDKKLEWAARLTHESRCHDNNIFVTLTYDEDHVPISYSLDKSHAVNFIRRLRYAIKPAKFKFFLVGEYGDQTKRPHYHAIIFGYWPMDAKRVTSEGLHTLFTSKLLTAAWGKGHVTFGESGPEACKYVSHYVVKKYTGEAAKAHYTRMNEFGELHEVIPEYAVMSRNPKGIGYGFYQNYKSDLRNGDFAMNLGKKQKIPRYYDKLLKAENEREALKLSTERKRKAKKYKANNTPERLATREAVAKSKLKSHPKRIIE